MSSDIKTLFHQFNSVSLDIVLGFLVLIGLIILISAIDGSDRHPTRGKRTYGKEKK